MEYEQFQSLIGDMRSVLKKYGLDVPDGQTVFKDKLADVIERDYLNWMMFKVKKPVEDKCIASKRVDFETLNSIAVECALLAQNAGIDNVALDESLYDLRSAIVLFLKTSGFVCEEQARTDWGSLIDRKDGLVVGFKAKTVPCADCETPIATNFTPKDPDSPVNSYCSDCTIKRFGTLSNTGKYQPRKDFIL